MSSLPAWIRISAETGMHQSNSRFIIRILKIREKCAKLTNQKHTLVNNGTAAHRTYIGVIIALLKLPAGNVQLAVKFQAFFHVIRFFHKCLHNIWHTFSGFMSKNLRNYGNLSPAKELQSFLFYDDFEHFLRLCTFDLVLREKELADSVFSFLSDFNSLFFTSLLEKLMGNLKKDTNTITGFSFCIFSCTVLQILYDPQCIGNCIMGFFSFDINNCSDSAVVMFKLLSVKSLPFRSHFFHFPHPFYC